MTYRSSVFVLILITVFFLPKGHAQGKQDFTNYEYYITEDGAFGLYKPKEWQVGAQKFPNGNMVSVTDQKNLSYVSLLFLEKIDSNVDSVAFAGSNLKNVIKQMPDLKIIEARSSRNRTRTVVKYQRTGPQNTLMEGKYVFTVKRPTGLVTVYEAPANHFKERVSTLMTVVANITVLDNQAYNQAYQKLASQRGSTAPKQLPMRDRSAQDGTCWLKVPEGWSLTAAKGAAACYSPDESTGYLFTAIGFVGQSRIPYFDSRSIPGLRYNYMRPIDALIVASRHTGATNHRVIERYPNQDVAMQASVFLKKQMDAEIVLISYTNKNGVPCVGYFDVLGSPPDYAGQWSIMPKGFWAPASQFAQYLPTLLEIAESFRIDERWAKEYVRRGMEKVREMMNNTSSMMYRYSQEMRASSSTSFQNRMNSKDYTSYKFSTYMRGEQEWVGGLEGGTIIKTDHYGLSIRGKYEIEGPPFTYYHFQGEKYGLIPVDSSREVFEAVKGY
jgi:hypothetical protein